MVKKIKKGGNMPEVVVRYHKGNMTTQRIQTLSEELPKIVAEALCAPGDKHGKITAEDIVVRFVEHGAFDVGVMDLEINITTVDTPERKTNLQERTDLIATKIQSLDVFKNTLLGKGTHYVWVILIPSGFKVF
jgi:hypothetical protein